MFFFKKNDFHCWVVTEANGDINLSPPISNQHHNLNYHHQLSSTRAYHLQFQTSITNLNYHHQLSSTRVRTGGDGASQHGGDEDFGVVKQYNHKPMTYWVMSPQWHI